MPSYNRSVVIAASRESVWSVLADVAAWADWLPTVNSVEPLDSRALSPGARFCILQPKLRPATWVVTQLEPPKRFVWESRSPGLAAIADHVVEEHSPGHSTVVLRMTFAGLLSGPVGLLFGSITEDYLSQEAATLKSVVEGRSIAR
jgi:uncharacterized membrane protein